MRTLRETASCLEGSCFCDKPCVGECLVDEVCGWVSVCGCLVSEPDALQTAWSRAPSSSRVDGPRKSTCAFDRSLSGFRMSSESSLTLTAFLPWSRTAMDGWRDCRRLSADSTECGPSGCKVMTPRVICSLRGSMTMDLSRPAMGGLAASKSF